MVIAGIKLCMEALQDQVPIASENCRLAMPL
jgi:hypothetical protein